MRLNLITASVLVTLAACAPLASVGNSDALSFQAKRDTRLHDGIKTNTGKDDTPGLVIGDRGKRAERLNKPKDDSAGTAIVENKPPGTGKTRRSAQRLHDGLQTGPSHDDATPPFDGGKMRRSAQRLHDGLQTGPSHDDATPPFDGGKMRRSAQRLHDGLQTGPSHDDATPPFDGGKMRRSAQRLHDGLQTGPSHDDATPPFDGGKIRRSAQRLHDGLQTNPPKNDSAPGVIGKSKRAERINNAKDDSL
ncbi:hypothetical protein FB567DRAFT_549304 [Paraphoma chrysanthemicola]|uniref:Uncharacterized protein n=1 Tax=Paraphoma chrysanthemicola TaxID=798071 RepID=A0A8K0R6L2_9PLEO|nr:hypothetical protein FB567DRAFT_549304 [Paraphoma chrysanthemicola]